MTHYVAIVEEEEGTGVWFPDLPVCFSAGDMLDEAMANAAEAPDLWAEAMIETGHKIAPIRCHTVLEAGPELVEELSRFMVGMIPFPPDSAQPAAT